MAQIRINGLSKRYGYQWIFRNLDYEFDQNKVYGISGSNGSGKSTLVKILSGYLTPSEGEVAVLIDGAKISAANIYQHVSLAAPYTDLINEFTLEEMFRFHIKFKKLKNNINFNFFEQKIQLPGNAQKTIQHFSSGMKQKIQLALALWTESPILLLDEPTSFLDQHAKKWFENLLNENKHDRLVILASNDGFDLQICDQVLEL